MNDVQYCILPSNEGEYVFNVWRIEIDNSEKLAKNNIITVIDGSISYFDQEPEKKFENIPEMCKMLEIILKRHP